MGVGVMFEKTKQFVKEHKSELVIGGVAVITTAVLGYKVNGYIKDIKLDLKAKDLRISDLTDDLVEVVYLHQQNLLRSIKDWEFEIDELKNFISNLNQELNINKFHRIPEKEARIHELEGFIEKAIKELAKTDSKIGYCDFL